jgi:hypothetical protein
MPSQKASDPYVGLTLSDISQNDPLWPVRAPTLAETFPVYLPCRKAESHMFYVYQAYSHSSCIQYMHSWQPNVIPFPDLLQIDAAPVEAVRVCGRVRPKVLVGTCQLSTVCVAHAGTHGISKALLTLGNHGDVGVWLLLEDGYRQVQGWEGKQASGFSTRGSFNTARGSCFHAGFICMPENICYMWGSRPVSMP